MTRLSRLERYASCSLLVTALVGGCASNNAGSPEGSAGTTTAKSDSATVYVESRCSFTPANPLVPVDPSQRLTASPEHPGFGHGGAVPTGFAPVSVIGCGMDVRNVPGDGVWQLATQTRAEGSLDDLVTAYRMPAPPPPGTGCTMELDVDPVIAFVDAEGAAVWPAPPRDARCGHISSRVNAAMKALHWTVTRSQRVGPT